jgi:threonine dehydratase
MIRYMVVRNLEPPVRDDICVAAGRIRPYLASVTVLESPGLDALLWLETFQPTGSFKVRGALAAMTALEPGERVVAASAGNHGLGVAYAATLLRLDATVVVAETASPAKLAALARFPIRLVRHGAGYDEAEAHALELAPAGSRYVSPYNDREVIAGQGTLALELLERIEPPVTIVCPVSGGGLCAGVGLWAARVPRARVVGVVAEASPAMLAAVEAGAVTPVHVGPTVADGLAGNIEPDAVTFELVRDHVEEVGAVAEDEIEAAMRFLVREHGLVAEGAGAAAAAAVLAGRVARFGRTVALVTGRNVDARTLTRVVGDS